MQSSLGLGKHIEAVLRVVPFPTAKDKTMPVVKILLTGRICQNSGRLNCVTMGRPRYSSWDSIKSSALRLMWLKSSNTFSVKAFFTSMKPLEEPKNLCFIEPKENCRKRSASSSCERSSSGSDGGEGEASAGAAISDNSGNVDAVALLLLSG